MLLKSLGFKFLIDLSKSNVPNFSSQPQPQLHTIFAELLSLLGRPSQVSVQGSFGDFLCLSTNAQRLCPDLFSLSTVN